MGAEFEELDFNSKRLEQRFIQTMETLSQAKGRIERLWETLQNRLPVEFKRRGITAIEQANAFLPGFIKTYNAEFAVKPAKNASLFVRLYDTSILDLMLAARVERKTGSAGVFQFHNFKFYIPDPACRGRKITLIMSERLGIKAMTGSGPKLYGIQFCGCFDNKQRRTQNLIERYLFSHTKETAKPLFEKRAAVCT
jgi:hypothetical protein